MEMMLNSAVLMLLILMSITFGTAYITQLVSAGGVVKPLEIALYWDKECTNSVSSISFGVISKGETTDKTFWLKSYSMDKGRISWNTANFNPSSDYIAATWERKVGNFVYMANWIKKMRTGDLWEIRYTLQVAQDTQVGDYGWDLTVCFTASEKVICLYVACALTVTP